MPSQKIIVPEGMRLAAGSATKGIDPEGYIIYPALEEALAWLADNPLRPTNRQIQEMSDSLTAQGDMYHSTESYCAEWQRRMFLAPEPPPIPLGIDKALRGVTLTPEQAEAIHELVNVCTRPSKEQVR